VGQRVALYCRVSTADQSCARQERDLTAFAERSGYEVVGIFKEIGSGVKLDRAERRKVMALAQAREVDALLVTELSRWVRSTTNLLTTLKELEARRVSVIALNGMAFDLSTPHGRMIATVLAGIAEFELELIQDRIRSGIAAARPAARGSRRRRRAVIKMQTVLPAPAAQGPGMELTTIIQVQQQSHELGTRKSLT
jgi:putative DNA-invertase from lambdoid prophage Rac